MRMDDSKGMDMAFEEAKQSYSEGGIPVRKDRCRTPVLAIATYAAMKGGLVITRLVFS